MRRLAPGIYLHPAGFIVRRVRVNGKNGLRWRIYRRVGEGVSLSSVRQVLRDSPPSAERLWP